MSSSAFSRPWSPQTYFVLVLVGLAVLLGVGISLAPVGLPLVPLGLSLLLALFLAASTLLLNHYHPMPAWIAPLNFFSLVYFVLYVVMTWDLLFLRGYSGNSLLEQNLSRALVLAIAAYLSFACGYAVVAGKSIANRMPNLAFVWSTRRLVLVLLFVVAAALFSLLTLIEGAGGIRSYFAQMATRRLLFLNQGYLLVLVNMIHVGLLLVFAYWLDTGRGRLALLLAGGLSGLALVSLGSRVSFFVLAIMLFFVYSHKRRRVQPWKIGLITLVLLVWAVFYGSFTREILPYGRLIGDEFGSGFDLKANLTSFWNRLAPLNFDSLGHLVFIQDQVPEKVDYLQGKSFMGLLFYPVPRSLYPEKPYGIGMLYTQVFYPETFENGSGVTPSLMVDFYWNFGLAGVFVGMFLFGILLRGTAEYASKNRNHAGAVVAAAVVTAHIFGWLKAGSDTPTQAVLGYLLPWLLFVFFFRWGKRIRLRGEQA